MDRIKKKKNEIEIYIIFNEEVGRMGSVMFTASNPVYSHVSLSHFNIYDHDLAMIYCALLLGSNFSELLPTFVADWILSYFRMGCA